MTPRSSRLLFLVPPALVLALLVLVGVHGLDLAAAHTFYDPAAGWPGAGNPWIEFLAHGLPKTVTASVCLLAAVLLVRELLARRRGADAPGSALRVRRLAVFLLSVGVCLLAVWALKFTTGVACPWSLAEFSQGTGSSALTLPGFSLCGAEGNCWPSGAAGSAFALLPAYFALRDDRPRLARCAFWGATVLGLIAGAARVTAGAHFPSHVIASWCVDWLVSFSLHVLFSEGPRAFARGLRQEIAGIADGGGPLLSAAGLVFFTAFWWTAVFDAPLFSQVLGLPQALTEPRVRLALGLAAALFLLAAGLLALLSFLPRAMFRGLLVVLSTAGALAFCASMLYGAVITPDMARNFLATDWAEASGYLSVRTAAVFLAAWLPPVWAALAADRRGRTPPGRGTAGDRHAPKRILPQALRRLGLALAMLAAGIGTALSGFQDLSGAVRTDPSLRWRIAPVNAVWAAVRTLASDRSPEAVRVRSVTDAHPRRTVEPSRPTLFVVVVGETARSADWGLAQGAPDTTPELGRRSVVSFPSVTACGTSTDVSLPCLMSRIGRSDYSRERILSEDALPDVLSRAGFAVEWIDNQSGCKGVCAGVPSRRAEPDEEGRKSECPGGSCWDGVLADEVRRAVGSMRPGQARVLFLHMIGSHGPAYADRSPAPSKVFQPECTSPDFGGCSRESIRHAYDNSIRYTDRVLADMIDALSSAAGVDTALLYVSDHGESLGENGLFLHGAPYWIAPDVQKTVPMVMWFSDAFREDYRVPVDALRRAAAPGSPEVTHEHVYSTLLGLLGVQSSNRRPDWDLTEAPREP